MHGWEWCSPTTEQEHPLTFLIGFLLFKTEAEPTCATTQECCSEACCRVGGRFRRAALSQMNAQALPSMASSCRVLSSNCTPFCGHNPHDTLRDETGLFWQHCYSSAAYSKTWFRCWCDDIDHWWTKGCSPCIPATSLESRAATTPGSGWCPQNWWKGRVRESFQIHMSPSVDEELSKQHFTKQFGSSWKC